MRDIPTFVRFLLPRCASALAVAAACTIPAAAQGPAQPAEPRVPVVEAIAPSAAEGARLLAASAARAAVASAPRPSEPPAAKPLTGWSASAHSFRDSILVSIARTALGARYVRGGESIDRGFDCSGLVRYVMTALRVPVPRTAAEQARVGIALGRDTARLRPGDLLTFGRGSRGVSHVGIYLGNGRYVHASSVARRVIESDIKRPLSPRVGAWRSTRRVLSGASRDSLLKDGG